MFERVKNLFKPKPERSQRSYMDAFMGAYIEAVLEDLPSGTRTSQTAFDTEHAAFFLPSEKLLIPPYPLHQFLTLYENDALAKALIDAESTLVVSPV